MTLSTTGIEVRHRSRWVREGVELISSMRFSISLLTLICIASTIGTVVKQGEPANNYVNQFGPFWSEVMRTAQITHIYSAWWFISILAVLVVSTSLCIARNAPKILHELRNFKEHVREQALQSFHLKGEGVSSETREAAYQRISALLKGGGWHARAQVRENGTMIAARHGAANKLGYIAAHSAIVLVCVGGLVDGDLIVRAQMALQGKRLFEGGDIKPENRLSASTPTFRATIPVSEGTRGSLARIDLTDGFVVVDLPFDIELKKFKVDYYATGMPKLFASDIVIHDHETGQSLPATVKVNEPAFHRGVAIYQSSFDDGGSTLKVHAIPMTAGSPAFDLTGVVGGTRTLTNTSSSAKETMAVEFTGLRVINVENLGNPSGGTDVRKVDLVGSLEQHLGSGVRAKTTKQLRNIGPSFSYKLVDASGQRREFNNYMLPVELEGQRVFLAGSRESLNEDFRYMRIPADETDSMTSWVALRAALLDPRLRAQAVARYVKLATPNDKPEMALQLESTATRLLALFAGAERSSPNAKPNSGGLQALSDFLESSVPEAERMRISTVLLRMMNATLYELLNVARENAGLKAMAGDDKGQAFMTQAVLSLSDSFVYPAPLLLQLADFQQVQASVFQVARAPGKKLVYTGAVLLIIGIFAMLYIRERRLWIWIAPAPDGGTKLVAAMSTTRRTMDADAEFERIKHAILPSPLAGTTPDVGSS